MTYPADERARLAYASGVDPLDHAAQEIAALLDAHAKTAAFCARNGYQQLVDTSPAVVSRRVLGLLIGAGWQVPGGLDIPETPEDLEATP